MQHAEQEPAGQPAQVSADPARATQRTDCFPGIPDAPGTPATPGAPGPQGATPPPPGAPEALTPLHVPTKSIIRWGLAAWFLALLATVAIPALHTGERSWWPWACVSGLVLGGWGYAFVARGRGNAADAE